MSCEWKRSGNWRISYESEIGMGNACEEYLQRRRLSQCRHFLSLLFIGSRQNHAHISTSYLLSILLYLYKYLTFFFYCLLLEVYFEPSFFLFYFPLSMHLLYVPYIFNYHFPFIFSLLCILKKSMDGFLSSKLRRLIDEKWWSFFLLRYSFMSMSYVCVHFNFQPKKSAFPLHFQFVVWRLDSGF